MFSEFDIVQYLKTLVLIDYNDKLVPVISDVLIVAFLIYSIFRMLRKTRGMQLLFGLAVFWFLGMIAKYFELELLDWIITMVSPALVFVVIIVLQPELRRIFSDFSQAKIVKFFMMKPDYQIDEIVEACRIMSKSKTGAIIVFVKDISLKDIIDQSVKLDALISTSLLLTIFKKNSALHDGAVIVEQNRIASASSYLPMSDSLGSSTLGARHRSALGLAEETDAVILVTSEETGAISICHDSEMIHPIKPFELKTQLLQMLTDKKAIKKIGSEEKKAKE